MTSLSRRLRHFINIQQVTRERDVTTGEFTDVWTTIHENIDCDIVDQSVRGYLQSRADQSEVQARVEIRYMEGLDSTMRFVGQCSCHLNKVYNPVGMLADNVRGNESLTFPCSQGVNDG